MMNKRLRQILSLLCTLALLLGCVTTAAVAESGSEQKESHIICVEWMDDNNAGGNRPTSIAATYAGVSIELTGPEWAGEISLPAGTTGSWTLEYSADGYTTAPISEKDGIAFATITKASVPTNPFVTAQVDWYGDDDYRSLRPESVQLILLGDKEPIGEPLPVKSSAGKSGTATWKNVPVYNPETGEPYVYSVRQMEKLSAYITDSSGLNVTNTLKTASLSLKVTLDAPEGADLSGLKLAIDGPDPLLKKTLTYADVKSGAVDLGTVLPGAYLVRDTNADTLVEGYMMDSENSKVADAVYVNSDESGTLEFKYTWKLPDPLDEEADEDYDPLANISALSIEILGPDPTMPLRLTLADFEKSATTYSKKLGNLVPGVYTVVERNAEKLVKYYTLTSNSTTGLAVEVKPDGTATAKLFNQYVPAPTPEPDAEFVDIPVTKTWNDNNNADGNRPASVTVRLYADGVEEDSHVLTAAEGWQFTFVEKPRYQDDNKTEIVYTVGEDAVAMYAATVNGYNIVNDYQPEMTSVSVSKVWDDNNDEQNLRPDSIAMSLSDGQKIVKVVVLSEANGWTATVNNLPTVVNGQAAQYAWKEQQVLSYNLEGVTQQGSLMVFTNKVWERPENPTAGRRPKTRGNTWYVFEDYDTPLGVNVVINHVGDCFD